ncbi:TIGR04222 domain-containing membrane protein [Nonomuraea sp. NPDC049784]|uniref:TIGR04222 domain-containing membrane protein n=1 Tax=Nonomuraea sp. NPDC049784 TaxID=3154361 RepID=UPI0033E5AD45
MDYVLLFAAFGVVFLVNAAEQGVERERRRVSEAAPSGDGHHLSPYELAYLSGGPRRVINTALVVLATAGAIRVSRGSQVTPVHGAQPSPVQIEQAVLDTLAARPGGCRAGELRRELEGHPALAGLVSGLQARGLIVPEDAYGTAWRSCCRLAATTRGACATRARWPWRSGSPSRCTGCRTPATRASATSCRRATRVATAPAPAGVSAVAATAPPSAAMTSAGARPAAGRRAAAGARRAAVAGPAAAAAVEKVPGI